MKELLRVSADGGKYTVVQIQGEGTVILRHGEPWLGKEGGSFPGVNAVLALAYEVKELRNEIGNLKRTMREMSLNAS